MRKEGVPPEPYWRLIQGEGVPYAEDDDFWQSIIPEMARYPQLDGQPTAANHPGRMLYEAGVSERRIERWLSMDRGRARRTAGGLLSQLDAGGGIDWGRLAPLLRWWDRARDDRLRRDFARNYFRGKAAAAARSKEE